MIRPENPNAFPAPDDGRPSDGYGMTLRDWFAGQALAGLLSHPSAENCPLFGDATHFAVDAYSAADAMMVERSKALAAATGEGL